MDFTDHERRALLGFSRQVIEAHLHEPNRVVHAPEGTQRFQALRVGLFVTLRLNGALRGCIGHIVPRGALLDEIRTVAVAAALHDYRFPPVTEGELDAIRIELSLLTPPVALDDPQRIRLGVDGVILTLRGNSAVFLPEVATEQGWSLEQMLDALCQKARIAADGWRDSATRFEVFQSIHFGEAT